MLEDVSNAKTIQIKNKIYIRYTPKFEFSQSTSVSEPASEDVCSAKSNKIKDQLELDIFHLQTSEPPRTTLPLDPLNAELSCSL
jgi:hypothetical protein